MNFTEIISLPRRQHTNMRDVKQINFRKEKHVQTNIFASTLQRCWQEGGKWKFQPHIISFSSSSPRCNICHFSILLFSVPQTFLWASRQGGKFYVIISQEHVLWVLLWTISFQLFKVSWYVSGGRNGMKLMGLKLNNFYRTLTGLHWKETFRRRNSVLFAQHEHNKSFARINSILKYIIDQHWYSICVFLCHMARDSFSCLQSIFSISVDDRKETWMIQF